jgi:hypothetical protein
MLSPVWAEPVDESGLVLDALEPFFMIEASWRTVLQESRLSRLFFMVDQAPRP